MLHDASVMLHVPSINTIVDGLAGNAVWTLLWGGVVFAVRLLAAYLAEALSKKTEIRLLCTGQR